MNHYHNTASQIKAQNTPALNRLILHLHSNSGPPVRSQFGPHCYSDEPIISLWRKLLCVSEHCAAHHISPRSRGRDWEGKTSQPVHSRPDPNHVLSRRSKTKQCHNVRKRGRLVANARGTHTASTLIQLSWKKSCAWSCGIMYSSCA